MFTITRITATVAVIAVAVAAGTSLAGPPATGDVVTLTLGTPSSKDRPASRLADAFAARVNTLSGGKLAIKVVYEAPGNLTPGTHTTPALKKLLTLVRTNKLQLATIWAPSLEFAGVKTVRAYQVPFLLTTKQAAARATIGATADNAMAGLQPASLTGLALVPQGLTRLFRVGKPILTPSDVRGARIRTNYGPTSFAALRSLGAVPNDLDRGAFGNGLANGSIDGFEAPFEIAPLFTAPSSATAGNLVLYPTITVLAANSAAFAALKPSQRSILRRAATQARTSTLAAWDDERDARGYCTTGRWIVRATPNQQSAMARLGRKAESLFARDPATAVVIGKIRAQRPTGSPAIVPCGSLPPKPAADPAGTTTLPPSGAYRRTLTAEAMRAAGADEWNIEHNQGTHTITIIGTRGKDAVANKTSTTSCDVTFSVSGPYVKMSYNPQSACGGPPDYFSWKPGGRDLMIEWRGFTGWDTLYNGLWTKAG